MSLIIMQAEFDVSKQLGLTLLQDAISQKTTLATVQVGLGWQPSSKPEPAYPELRDLTLQCSGKNHPMETLRHCATETEQMFP